MSQRRRDGRPQRLGERLAGQAPASADEPGAVLAAMVDHTRRIAALDASLGRLLDAPLKAHCRVANLRDRHIVLTVDSPVWSQRVRFLLPEIARRLNAELEVEPGAGEPSGRAGDTALRAVRVRVGLAPTSPPAAPMPGPTPPSPDAARVLLQVAEAATDDRLRDALRRLASRSSGRGPNRGRAR